MKALLLTIVLFSILVGNSFGKSYDEDTSAKFKEDVESVAKATIVSVNVADGYFNRSCYKIIPKLERIFNNKGFKTIIAATPVPYRPGKEIDGHVWIIVFQDDKSMEAGKGLAVDQYGVQDMDWTGHNSEYYRNIPIVKKNFEEYMSSLQRTVVYDKNGIPHLEACP